MVKAKLLKKVLGLVLVGALSLGMNVFVAGQEGIPTSEANKSIVSPRFIAIVEYSNGLRLNSGGRLTCQADTSVQMGYIAGVTIELQQFNGGWSTIKTWSAQAPKFAELYQDWYVAKNYDYRLKVTHRALNSGGSIIENFISYSRTVSYN